MADGDQALTDPQGEAMAEGDRNGVGDVGWFRKVRQPELLLDSPLHLSFRSPAGPGERLFHLGGCIGMNLQTALGGGQAEHPAGVPHQDRRARAFIVGIELFDGKALYRMAVEDLAQTLIKFSQPLLQRATPRGGEDACLHQSRRTGWTAQDRIAGNR